MPKLNRSPSRWLKLAPALAVAGIVGACSTTSKRQAPSGPLFPSRAYDSHVDDVLNRGRDPSPAMTDILDYKKAISVKATDPSEACRILTGLVHAPEFPLGDVARIRAIEICPAESPDYKMTTLMDHEADEPWLKDVFDRAALNRAVKVADPYWEMLLSADVAKVEAVQANQIKLLRRAIDLAKVRNDVEHLNSFDLALQQIAPRFLPDPKPEKYFSVASDFKRAREFAKAREYYDKIVSSTTASDTEKYRALDGIRQSYKLEKKTPFYIDGTRKAAAFARERFYLARPQNLGRYFDAQLSLARALWTEGDADSAQTILLQLEKELHGRYPLEESLLTRALIESEKGAYERAAVIFEAVDPTHLAQNKSLKEKIFWLRAWNDRKLKKFADAEKTLEQLVQDQDANSTLSSTMLARDTYWLARTRKDLGHGALAEQGFNWLIDNDPIGYYGLLAYRELNRKLPALPGLNEAESKRREQELPDTVSVDPLSTTERLKLEWALALDENEVATRLLNSLPIERRAAFTQSQTFEILRSFARAGSYQALFARLPDLPASARKDLVENEPELIFPQRWKEIAQGSAAKYNVRPELVFSIIRQESAFNPLARSSADAFGLMQMIPEMARRAEAETGVRFNANEDLYKPELNIPLGTAFLHSTLNKWKGAFIPTVASYNASEKAVGTWLRLRATDDPTRFIEDVPYEETRTYLKLVLRNFVFYSRLNSKHSAIDFPEWCLTNQATN